MSCHDYMKFKIILKLTMLTDFLNRFESCKGYSKNSAEEGTVALRGGRAQKFISREKDIIDVIERHFNLIRFQRFSRKVAFHLDERG